MSDLARMGTGEAALVLVATAVLAVLCVRATVARYRELLKGRRR